MLLNVSVFVVYIQKLRLIHQKLVNSVSCVDTIISAMYSSQALTRQELEQIQAQESTYKKIEGLLSVVLSRPVHVYKSFLKCLRDTYQTHVYSLIVYKGLLQNSTITCCYNNLCVL